MARYKTIEDVFSNLNTININDSELSNIFYSTRAYRQSIHSSHQNIVGPPGSGKSMILRRLSVSCAGISNPDFIGIFISPMNDLAMIAELPHKEEICRRVATNIAFLLVCRALLDLQENESLKSQGWIPDDRHINAILKNYISPLQKTAIEDKINAILNGSDLRLLSEYDILRRIGVLDDLIFGDLKKHMGILIDDFGECDKTAQEGLAIYFRKETPWCCKASFRWGTYRVSAVNKPFETPELGRKVEVSYLDDRESEENTDSKNILKIASRRLQAYVDDNPELRKGFAVNIEDWFPKQTEISPEYCTHLIESKTDHFLYMLKHAFSFAERKGPVFPPLHNESFDFGLKYLFDKQKVFLDSIDSIHGIPKLLDFIATEMRKIQRRGDSAGRTIVLEKPLKYMDPRVADSIRTGISKGVFLPKSSDVNIDNIKVLNVSRLVLKLWGVELVPDGNGKNRVINLPEKRIKGILYPYDRKYFPRAADFPIRFVLATKWRREHGGIQAERDKLWRVIREISDEHKKQGSSIKLSQVPETYSLREEWYKIFLQIITKSKQSSERIVPLINITHPSSSIFLELGICCAKCNIIYLIYNPEANKALGEEGFLPAFIKRASGKIITDFSEVKLKLQIEDIINLIRGNRTQSFGLPLPRRRVINEETGPLNLLILVGKHEALDDIGIKRIREQINVFGQKSKPQLICKQIKNLGSLDWNDVKSHARDILSSDIILVEFGDGKMFQAECSFFAGFSMGLGKRKTVILSSSEENKDCIDFWWGPRLHWNKLERLVEGLMEKVKIGVKNGQLF